MLENNRFIDPNKVALKGKSTRLRERGKKRDFRCGGAIVLHVL
jgi:hypothetical protein